MGHVQRHVGVLFHEQNRRALAIDLANHLKMLRTICGARPSDGSSSISSFGRATSARAIASICCSPPESVPACWLKPLANAGNKSSARSRSAANAGAILAREARQLQVLVDREIGEDLAAFRHLHQAALHDPMRRPALNRLAVELDRCRASAAASRRSCAASSICRPRCADQRHDFARSTRSEMPRSAWIAP